MSCLFGLTALVQAKPLDVKNVPADVQWVAHMDVDAMRASPVIEKAFQAASEQWPDQLEGHMDRSARRVRPGFAEWPAFDYRVW